MYTNQRTISRVLAAAVASTGFAFAPMPTFAASLTCTSATFTATADNSGNIVVSCTAPGSTASCSLSASPSSLPASGGTVTLTATNCGSVTSWAKNSNQVATSGNTFSESIPANTGTSSLSFTYTVQGANGASTVTVMEAAAGSTSPPPVATTCDGYTVIPVDLPWTATSKVITKGFNNNTIVVARFTTPATSAISGSASLASAEFGDAKTTRTASLSTLPCDLTGTGVGKAAVFAGNTQTPGYTYQINGTVSFLSSRVVLQPSTTYYFNIVNRDSKGSPSCGTTTCNMIIQMTLPTGL